jgi:hypothetical protein
VRCRNKRANFEDTLHLEVYFKDDRPKLELEYYSLQPHGMLRFQLKSVRPLICTSLRSHSPKEQNKRSSVIKQGIELDFIIFRTVQAKSGIMPESISAFAPQPSGFAEQNSLGADEDSASGNGIPTWCICCAKPLLGIAADLHYNKC